MKKTNKKLFGFLGLTAVAAITVFAAFLPAPETQAVTSVTDTISVRVVGPQADIIITSPEDGEDITSPTQTITYDYIASKVVTTTLEYTDENGVTTSYILDVLNLDYETGSGSIPLDLNDPKYGYGDYVVKIKTEGVDGFTKEVAATFSYYPVTVSAEPSKEEGKVDVSLEYDETNPDIDKIVINVYDEDGNLIEGLSPVTVTPPNKTITLDFASYGLEPGIYTITATAYDADGNMLFRPYSTTVKYDIEEKAVPNTGAPFQNMNISKTDYLITGLIAFGLVAAAGIIFAIKNGKSTNKRK